jgi:hypothetical protein
MSVLAVGNSVWELLAIVGIVLVPLVPITYFAWSFLGRRRGAGIESGRSSATPFAAISVVGTVVAVAAFAALLVVVAVRAAAV